MILPRSLGTATQRSAAASVLFVLLAVPAAFVAPAVLSAQQSLPTGRVTGRIVDASTGQGLSDVGVQIVGTTIGAQSGVDGRFTVARVPAGTVTIQARRIGYQAKTVTGIVLAANGAVEQDITLAPASVQLTATVVTASAERGTVSAALDQQRTATGIVNAVTSEQIARSPDSDAAAAVQRVSGVTVQDGKYVFVRGLGERYTTASLNGARIPSPEPERKVVPLDLFPAGLLQSVTTSKTFTPDQPGDFSGAQVDIQTREFPAERRITYAASAGFNSAATGSPVLRAPGGGMEWLGFAGAGRALPGAILGRPQFGTLVPSAEANALARSFRNEWSPRVADGSPNSSTGVSIGGQDPVLGHPVGYIGSLSYATSQEIRSGERGAASRATGDSGAVAVNQFAGTTGRQSVLWGGLFNLSTMVGQRTRLAFNNTFNRSADNEARQDTILYEPLATSLQRSTLRFVERTIRSNQLRGEHALSDRHQLDWFVTSSGVRRREPDRSDLVYARDIDPVTGRPQPFALLEQSLSSSRRTFADLDESNVSADARYRLTFGSAERQGLFRAGAFARSTRREAINLQYNLQLRPGRLTAAQRQAAPEQIFDGRYATDTSGVFNLQQVSAGGSYEASDDVTAGFAMAEYPLTDRVRLIGGARVEHASINVLTQQTAGADTTATLVNTDVLPSLALNVKLSETQSLRLSGSQTLARPEYRELSPVSFFEVLGGGVVFGNAGLRRSLIQNYDARWEWYPSSGEILSIGAFAKRFRDPIERVDVATSGEPQVTFVNAEGATNYGVELEMRKGLGFLGERLAPLAVFTNATLMRSDITLGNRELASNTNDSRPMVGQAPYVLNGGVTYTSGSGRSSATLLFNRVGRRIVAAGAAPLPDNYEQARSVLDLSLRFPVAGSLAAKLDARNLLDSPFVIRQGDVTRERYTFGRVVSLGLSWQR